MTTWITICETCKRDGWDASGKPVTDGADLAARVEAVMEDVSGLVRMRRHSCLMGCGKGCNVAIQAQGKLCYTLGGFEPSDEAAQGIVAYAILHSESESGQVPYRQWPQAIKGHFVTRHPPLPEA